MVKSDVPIILTSSILIEREVREEEERRRERGGEGRV
jgi:hypothetical protein